MSEHDSGGESRGFPYVAVVVSAVILIAIGAWLLNLASAGALPTALGIGAEMPDILRRVVIVVILLAIAAVAFVYLRRES